MRQDWKQHADRDRRLTSAIRIAETIAGLPQIYPPHQRELLSIAVWKASEIDGKMNTRYVTVAALGSTQKRNHEHVVPRKLLVDEILRDPSQASCLLRNLAIGCVVTVEEHKPFGDDAFGWDRYAAARVEVFDRATDGPLDLNRASAELHDRARACGIRLADA